MGAALLHAGKQTDGRTDKMEFIRALHYLCERASKQLSIAETTKSVFIKFVFYGLVLNTEWAKTYMTVSIQYSENTENCIDLKRLTQ